MSTERPDAEMLKGLRGVVVVVESLDDVVKEAGLVEFDVRFELEKCLASVGINVRPLYATKTEEGIVYGYLSIGAEANRGGSAAVSLTLQLAEPATLVRKPHTTAGVTT